MTRSTRTSWYPSAVVALLIGTILVGMVPASGQSPLDDKRAEARQVAARLDELGARYSRLSDRANEAQAEMAVVQEHIGQAQARLDETVRQRDQRRAELQSYAVGAYLGGPANSALTIAVDSRNESEMPIRLGYLDAVTGNRAELIDQLRVVEEDVADRMVDLEESRSAADDLVQQIDQAAADADQAIAEQEQLRSQIDTELEGLIEEQRQRDAAAQQAAIDAAARPTADQTAAQPPTGDPSTSNDDDGGSGGTTPVDPPVPPPPTTGAQGAVNAALSMRGVPYQWAGASPSSGFDCSGLMMWAWAQAGRSLPHSSRMQYSVTRRVSASDLQPGDLVFYGPSAAGIHHVAMYIGGGQIVDALNSGSVVSVRSIGYPGSIYGYGRP